MNERPPDNGDQPEDEDLWIAPPEEFEPPDERGGKVPVFKGRASDSGRFAVLGFLFVFIGIPVTFGIAVANLGGYGALAVLAGVIAIIVAASRGEGFRSFLLGMGIAFAALVVAGGICYAIIVSAYGVAA